MRIRWYRRSADREPLQLWVAGETGTFLSPGARSLLRDTRKRSGYSLRELAEAIGVEPDELMHLERGEYRPELAKSQIELMVARYAVCLGLDPDAFLMRDETWVDPSEVRRWVADGGSSGSS